MAARRSRTKSSQPRAFVSSQLKSKERGRISHVIDIMEYILGEADACRSEAHWSAPRARRPNEPSPCSAISHAAWIAPCHVEH